MGRKIFKAVKKSFIFLLTVVMLINALPMAVIATEANPLYIKDVKIITAKSMEEAEKVFKNASTDEEKYLMINTNLNEGTGEDGVYMAYVTTTNENEAITDMKVMNMNGGFTMTNYQEEVFNKQYKTPLNEMASQFKNAVDEFRQNYNNGYTGAKYAYQTLNFFVADDVQDVNGNPVRLGDYFLYNDVQTSYLLKMITLCHTTILTTIYNTLTLGVQQPVGENWVDRLSAAGSEVDDDELSTYYDASGEIYDVMYNFADRYNMIDHDVFSDVMYNFADRYNMIDHDVFSPEPELEDEGDEDDIATEDNEVVVEGDESESDNSKVDDEISELEENDGSDALYEVAVAMLRNYYYGTPTTDKDGNVIPPDDTLDVVFTNDCMDEETLIPLIKSLTPGQFAMLRMGGPLNMILYSNTEESFFTDYQAQYDEATSEYSSCSIWEGVDQAVFNNTVAITEEAAREMADTKTYNALICDTDTFNDRLEKTVNLISAGLTAIAGVAQITAGIITISIKAGLISAASKACWSAIASWLTTVSTVFGYVTLAATIALAVYMLVDLLVGLYKYYYPTYTDIPTYMYDTAVDEYDENVYVQYKCVTDLTDKNMDVNIWEGKEWVAVYTSRDPVAGQPIKADFNFAQGNGITPKDYMPLAKFGEEVAENLNKYDFDDDVNGIYLFYKQDPEAETSSKVKYISNIIMQTGSSEFECLEKLERMSYKPINVNLTPADEDVYTYVGYKLTSSKKNALTDIRLTDGYNAGSFLYGYASYGEHGTSNGITLYATKMECAGTPILEVTATSNVWDIADGYEPVNLFSGGPAYNLNKNIRYTQEKFRGYYLAFLPSETYTEGPDYLGGINVFDSNYETDDDYDDQLYMNSAV